jgi:nucleoside-diphosphate-sugar epimerase
MSYKILVTGTGTPVGNSIAKYLSLNGHSLIATYNNKKPKNLKNCKIIKIDLSKNIKKKINFDYLIHCASKIPKDGQSIKNYRQNINFIKNLLKLVNKNKCRRIIFLSAVSLYGKPLTKKINENTAPRNPKYYGQSKMICEKKIIEFSKNKKINYTILRLPAIIGSKIKNNFISNIFEKISSKQPVDIFNINQEFNNVIHINTLTKIIYKIILKEKKNSIYLVGSKHPIKVKSIMKIIKESFYKDVKFNIVKTKTKNFILNNKKILKNKYELISTKRTIIKGIESFKKYHNA